jgi:hypothetical protein
MIPKIRETELADEEINDLYKMNVTKVRTSADNKNIKTKILHSHFHKN